MQNDCLQLLSIVTAVKNNRTVSRHLTQLNKYHHSTYIHSLHVAVLSVQIGAAYGLSKNRLFNLAYGALLHDIGKCRIPLDILDKKSSLTEEEFARIKSHPVNSYYMVHNHMTFGKDVSKLLVELICLMHHLKPNGSGYPGENDPRPDGIDYTRIPTECRIVTICDIYDALVEVRPYKHCFSHYDALDELRRLGEIDDVDMRFVDILEKLIFENRLILQTTSLGDESSTPVS